MKARGLISIGLATLGISIFGSASAWAGVGHGFARSFGPGGPGVGSFISIQGVAVDQSTEDVYVYDFETASIYKFNAAGEPADFSALGTNVIEGVGGSGNAQDELAVDNSTGPTSGDIYVAGTVGVFIFGPDGASLGALTEGVAAEVPGAPWGGDCGVAVDTTGHVYIGLQSGHVNKYTPTGGSVTNANYTSSLWGLSEQSCNIAVDSAGSVYVDTASAGPVTKYEPSQFNTTMETAVSIPSETLFDERGSTLTTDPPNTGDVYIDEGSDIAEYTPAGTRVGEFGETGSPGGLSESIGVAVNTTTGKSASGDVYVGDVNNVEIFEPGPTPPAPSTDPATAVTGVSATLHGELDPEGKNIDFYFSYAPGTNCTSADSIKTPIDNEGLPASGTNEMQESVTVENLEGNTQYAFCLVARNAFGSLSGAPLQFTTTIIKPVILSETGSGSSSSEATLSAEIAPENLDTHYHFEYGTEAPTYGEGSPIPDADAGSTLTNISQTIHGLQPDTTYHYRVVATNSAGTEDGIDQTFETLPLAPVVTLGQVTSITATTATLPALIEPNGANTTYHFYDFETSECTEILKFLFETCPTSLKTPMNPEGDAGTSPSTVTANLIGLQPGTTYTYWLDAHNSGGSAGKSFTGNGYGTGLTFTTLPLPPVVSAQPATDVATTTATGVGIVDTQAGDLTSDSIYHTTYHFEYGPTVSYGIVSPLPDADAGSGNASLVVGAPFVDLQPGTEYHYRIVAINGGGTVYGPDETFITRSSYVTPPSAITAGTSDLAATSVTLDGVLNAQGAETFSHFEYGTGTSYGSVVPTPNADAGSETTDLGVSESVAGLQPGTSYHYRLVANNAGGTTYGADQTFTTAGTAPPAANPPAFATFPDLSALAPPPPVPLPTSVSKVAAKKTRAKTRAEKLDAALKKCEKKEKAQRASCEKHAHKQYAANQKKARSRAKKATKKKRKN